LSEAVLHKPQLGLVGDSGRPRLHEVHQGAAGGLGRKSDVLMVDISDCSFAIPRELRNDLGDFGCHRLRLFRQRFDDVERPNREVFKLASLFLMLRNFGADQRDHVVDVSNERFEQVSNFTRGRNCHSHRAYHCGEVSA
jgi:hypothetical protein